MAELETDTLVCPALDRYMTEGYVDWIVWVAGIVQTGLYSDFLYVYITKWVWTSRSRKWDRFLISSRFFPPQGDARQEVCSADMNYTF